MVFAADVAIMLLVTDDRRRWLRGHRFELAVLVVAFPVLPAASPAFYGLELVPSLELANVVSLAKLGKAVRTLRRRALRRDRHGIAGPGR